MQCHWCGLREMKAAEELVRVAMKTAEELVRVESEEGRAVLPPTVKKITLYYSHIPPHKKEENSIAYKIIYMLFTYN